MGSSLSALLFGFCPERLNALLERLPCVRGRTLTIITGNWTVCQLFFRFHFKQHSSLIAQSVESKFSGRSRPLRAELTKTLEYVTIAYYHSVYEKREAPCKRTSLVRRVGFQLSAEALFFADAHVNRLARSARPYDSSRASNPILRDLHGNRSHSLYLLSVNRGHRSSKLLNASFPCRRCCHGAAGHFVTRG